MAEVPTPQPLSDRQAEQVIADEIAAIIDDTLDSDTPYVGERTRAAGVLAALREAGYQIVRLEQVGWAYCAHYRGDRWYAYTDHADPLPHSPDDEPVWRVVGPVEPSDSLNGKESP